MQRKIVVKKKRKKNQQSKIRNFQGKKEEIKVAEKQENNFSRFFFKNKLEKNPKKNCRKKKIEKKSTE